MTQSWEPANETERAMVRALLVGDRQEFFRILAFSDLYLPQRTTDQGGPQRLMTMQLFGQTFLPVFTSIEGMAAQVGGAADGYAVTNCAELRRKWPNPQWRLAVNIGSPIDMYLPIESVQAAALGDIVVPTVSEMVAEAERAPAEGDIDPDGYIQDLLDTVVLLPTLDEVPDANQILADGFPWRPVGTEEAPFIEVFTSEETFAEAYPEPVPTVTVAFPFVLSLWPEGHNLAVDPRTAQELTVPSEHVQMLLLLGPPEDAEEDER